MNSPINQQAVHFRVTFRYLQGPVAKGQEATIQLSIPPGLSSTKDPYTPHSDLIWTLEPESFKVERTLREQFQASKSKRSPLPRSSRTSSGRSASILPSWSRRINSRPALCFPSPSTSSILLVNAGISQC